MLFEFNQCYIFFPIIKLHAKSNLIGILEMLKIFGILSKTHKKI